VSEGIGRADRLAIVGWSYGGYAALQSQVLEPALFRAVAAIAPMTQLGYVAQDARAYTNSRIVDEFIGSGPHLETGGPRRQAARLAAPAALYHGARDLNVDVRHSQEMAKALKTEGKSVVYREYKDLQHDLGD
jgi:dipeptidyl aminopeptidase/acylaminoacyl peptidase